MSFDPIVTQDLDQSPTKPCIETHNRQQRDIRADALDALLKANNPPRLFQRNGHLAIWTTVGCEKVLKRVEVVDLRCLLHDVADWLSNGRAVAQPRELAAELLASQNWNGIPHLIGISPGPVLPPDGEMVTSPGYCPRTKLFITLDALPSKWTQNVQSAKDFINEELFKEFPFLTSADKANAWALMLEPFLRPTFDGCSPIYVIDAPKRNSGKTYCGKVCVAPFIGTEPTTTDFPTTEEEMVKTLITVLSEGEPITFFDNMEGHLKSAALARTLTTRFSSGRLLKSNKLLKGINNCTWIATSNNARLHADLVTRAVWIRIDPNCEFPEKRQFKKDVLSWALASRTEVLGAIVHILNGWHRAGRPLRSGPIIGRFPSWFKTVGGVLEYIEIEGFMENYDVMQTSLDDIGVSLRAFFPAAHLIFGDRSVTAAELFPIVEHDESLAGLLSPGDPKKSLGRQLMKWREAIHGGIRMTHQGKKQGANLFQFSQVLRESGESSDF